MACKNGCPRYWTVLVCHWLIVFLLFSVTDVAKGTEVGHGRDQRYTIRPTHHGGKHQARGTPYRINGKGQGILINPSYDQYRVAVTNNPNRFTAATGSLTGTPRVYLLNGPQPYVLKQNTPDHADTASKSSPTVKQYPDSDYQYKYPISLEGDTIGGNANKYGENAGTGTKRQGSQQFHDAFSFLRLPGVDQRQQGQGQSQGAIQVRQPGQQSSSQFPSGPFQPDFRTSEQNREVISRQLFPLDDVIAVTDCALLEEADSDVTGRTHCLAEKRCSSVRVPRECAGRERTRTPDGTCNNLRHPMWGSAFQPFKRYLPPHYSDGAGHPRNCSIETDGHGRALPLPSARLVSRTVHLITEKPSEVSGLLMQFGQFIDHDISGTSSTRGTSGAIKCCNQEGSLHEACWPIEIPPGDTHYTESTCINFIRSLPASDHNNVTLVPRQQRNEVTSYLDGSVVYGSSQEQLTRLRSFQGGELASSAGDMLPLEKDGSCNTADELCLISGDARVNEVPGLGALHVIFHRQHNRLARQLAAILNGDITAPPHVVDEAIFQTARRIVGAQLQHIVYTEWLPLVVGPFAMQQNGLSKGRHTYDDTRDPRLANVFAAAAFRFGHSLVPDWLSVGGDIVPLHTVFSDSTLVRNRLDDVIAWLLEGVAQTRDHFFVSSLRNRLFEQKPRHGLDLVAINIQRGRDHGLPSYQKWRAACGLSPVSGFNDTVLGSAGPALREVYLSVEDIDLFTGALCERPLEGAVVGETLACLIGRQFADMKYGDRFFYETSGPEGFTDGQMQFIGETTLAGLLCANTHSLNSVQKNVFLKPSAGNPRVSCSQWRSPAALHVWRDELHRLLHSLTTRERAISLPFPAALTSDVLF